MARMSDPSGSSPGCSILAMLANVALTAADTVALASEADRLTFAELFSLACDVALQVRTATPIGATIAVVLPHSPRGLARLLGCIAAGRMCFVLSPTEPAERLAEVLEDALPFAIFVEHESLLASVALRADTRVLTPDSHRGPIDPRSWPAVDADAPAMVHYTSGSSGKPKGIVLSLRSAFFRARACVESWQVNAADRLMATSLANTGTGLAFVLAALMVGARMLVVNVAGEGAAAALRLARRERATILSGGPAMIAMLLRLDDGVGALISLRILRVGSAPFPQRSLVDFRRSLPAGCAVTHTYASTEAMVMASWVIPPDFETDDAYLPVGYGSRDPECLLVDDAGCPVARGEVGEMIVRSPHIALGEWQRGTLAEGRICPDPARPGWRVFRTGDLLRIGPDGLLRFVSRADRQIKINGVRIEPAEIEGVIRREPGVTDVVVAPRVDRERVSLQAFVAAPDRDVNEVRASLRLRLRNGLPPAMRPGTLVIMPSLPRLPGGKVDLQMLRRLASSEASDA